MRVFMGILVSCSIVLWRAHGCASPPGAPISFHYSMLAPASPCPPINIREYFLLASGFFCSSPTPAFPFLLLLFLSSPAPFLQLSALSSVVWKGYFPSPAPFLPQLLPLVLLLLHCSFATPASSPFLTSNSPPHPLHQRLLFYFCCIAVNMAKAATTA